MCFKYNANYSYDFFFRLKDTINNCFYLLLRTLEEMNYVNNNQSIEFINLLITLRTMACYTQYIYAETMLINVRNQTKKNKLMLIKSSYMYKFIYCLLMTKIYFCIKKKWIALWVIPCKIWIPRQIGHFKLIWNLIT